MTYARSFAVVALSAKTSCVLLATISYSVI